MPDANRSPLVRRLDTLGEALLNAPQRRPGAFFTLFALLVIGLVVTDQLLSPIRMGDTDMWYHLNGGRWMLEHGSVVTQPFFSVLDGSRPWVSYFYGFQLLIYALYEQGGYLALLLLRAGAVALIGLLLFGYLWQGVRRGGPLLAFAIAGAIALMLLDGRLHQVRPHMITYLGILCFLWILEFRPRWSWLLPLLTVVWANLHGVTWVLAALIGGAYFLDALYRRYREGVRDASTAWPYLTGIALCAPALLLNPRGLAILTAPFAVPENIDRFIAELQPLAPSSFQTLQLSGMQLGNATLITLFTLLVLFAFVRAAIGDRLRLAHLVMAAGGAYLLTRGNRFLHEWLLLSLPLLASLRLGGATSNTGQSPSVPPAPSPGQAILLLLALLLPLQVARGLKAPEHHPFDPAGLPVGITAFLQEQGYSGNLLTPPGPAGYVQWILGDRVRIFIDMQFPPATAQDFVRVATAYRNVDAFRQLDAEFAFDFVSANKDSRTFAAISTKLDELTPIWFDDTQVLFVNNQRHPEIAERWAIAHLNPFNLLAGEAELADKAAELERIHAAAPEMQRPPHALARFHYDLDNFAQSLSYAERFMALAPKDPNGPMLAGMALQQQERCTEATPLFAQAIGLADTKGKAMIRRLAGDCYYQLEDFPACHAAYEASLQVHKGRYPAEELFQGAFCAAAVGDYGLATFWGTALLAEWSEENPEMAQRARDLLDDLPAHHRLPLLDALLGPASADKDP